MGCNLTVQGTPELEASFASITSPSGKVIYGSVTGVDYSAAGGAVMVSELAAELYKRQVIYQRCLDMETRPPM